MKRTIQNIATCDISIKQFNSELRKQEFKKIKNHWNGMIDGCYSKRNKFKPSYKGCVVCDDWLLFSNFYKWAIKQNYSKKCLHRLVKTPDEKIYSPDNCVFVSIEIKYLLGDHTPHKSLSPVGVTFVKSKNIFKASMSFNGHIKYLGHYNNPDDAERAYKRAKRDYIIEVAKGETGEVRDLLLLRADEYLEHPKHNSLLTSLQNILLKIRSNRSFS